MQLLHLRRVGLDDGAGGDRLPAEHGALQLLVHHRRDSWQDDGLQQICVERRVSSRGMIFDGEFGACLGERSVDT